MIEYADIVTGLVLGDEGKGKIASLLATSGEYNLVARWNGGNNAGHTVYVNGKKYKSNLVPSGVFAGVQSLIGPGCVLHPESFYAEVKYIEDSGFDSSLIKVDPRCHIITNEHIQYDKEHLAGKLGTTSKGIAPAYAAKAGRTGIQAKSVLEEKYLWKEKLSGRILCEGAQGVWLDIDHGDYPYVTSSHTLPYAAAGIGFPPQKIRKIYGVAKLYDTKSGVDPLFPKELLDDPVLTKIGELGKEFGVVTGRRRIVNWLRLDRLIESINLTGTTHLIINKCDILKEISQEYEIKLLSDDGIYLSTSNFDYLLNIVKQSILENCSLIQEISFSYSPEHI